MLPELRHSRAAVTQVPDCVTPVLGMMLQLLAEQWEGTLLVDDARDERVAALRFVDGFVV